MNPYSQTINKLIPADQLQWNEEEGKYKSICKEEAMKIWEKCDQLSEEDKVALIMWYQKHKICQILWENFMKGNITISGVKDGEPAYVPKEL